MSAGPWDGVVGQRAAVERLAVLATNPVHAYLFVGPEGCGKEEAARAFAAVLVDGPDPSERTMSLVARGGHPDVIDVLREGAAVDKEEADHVIRAAATTASGGARKVVVIHEVHLMRDSAAVRLLKTIEEPPETVAFVLLADQLVPALATIASRCVAIHFARLDDVTVAGALVARGTAPDAAAAVARMADGNLDRALLLASDPQVVAREQAFASVPRHLDGSGSRVASIVDQLLQHIEQATAPLAARHAGELAELEERVAVAGERGSGRKSLSERHKRQLRKFRTDELRAGLRAIAATYLGALRDAPDDPRAEQYLAAVTLVNEAAAALALNANEELALQAMLLQCPPVHA